MATQTGLMRDFVNEIKKGKMYTHPWRILSDKQIAYNASIYAHSFRKNTMPATVKLYAPIINAVTMYAEAIMGTPLSPAGDFQMVARRTSWEKDNQTVRGKEYLLELIDGDVSDPVHNLFHKKGDAIRMACYSEDSGVDAFGEFKSVSQDYLSMVILLVMPEILEADTSGKITDKINDLATHLVDFPTWTTETDIPELVKEAAFFVSDAIFAYCNDVAKWNFSESTTSSVPDEPEDRIITGGLKGAVAFTTNPNVNFRYAISNGLADNGTSKVVTIAEAKAEFASFSSHRNWSAAEKMMIPSFDDRMPVMPETIRMARRIVGTRDHVNPVVQMMWRGVTSYGKSTGVKQLACILNMPLLIQTCHPGLEISELKSTMVPATEDDGLEVDLDLISLNTENELPVEVAKAVAHVEAMEAEERREFLSGASFFMSAMMDAESAAYDLYGEDVAMASEELCQVYADVVCYFREKPLRSKIALLENTVQDEPEEKKDNKPAFKHIVANYAKALINGYIVEIQEPSRIRDSGVLVGINEYDRPGAVIHLMNGAIARRHKDAICVFTDNVGYGSCRPIDPSVLRRMGLIIDSYELPEKMVKDRVRMNTGCKDDKLLDRCYKLWNTVKEFCDQNSITEGSVSPMELERFVQAVMLDGEDSIEVNFADCVVSKASSSIDDQRDIKTACETLAA